MEPELSKFFAACVPASGLPAYPIFCPIHRCVRACLLARLRPCVRARLRPCVRPCLRACWVHEESRVLVPGGCMSVVPRLTPRWFLLIQSVRLALPT